MELILLDQNLIKVKVIDIFHSLLWIDRYSSCGDFELFLEASVENIQMLQEDYYLTMPESEHVMIIESINLKTDTDNGNEFIVKGRSLETIIERRIVWQQTVLNGSLQEEIKRLLNENAISPSDGDRRISNLIFQTSTDVNITSLSVDAQFTGDNLYDAIKQLCVSSEIGFKITMSLTGQFVFSLYVGEDRSYDQIANPFVAFSPSLDNLSNTNYYHSKKPYKNVTLVGGEGEGSQRLTNIVMIPGGGGTDLERREMFTDARDISSWVNGVTITLAAYNALLRTRGIISLLENQPESFFDGKVDYTTTYIYGVDFFMGDIVQVANEYGLQSRSRITELIYSENLGGIDVYPTFTKIE